MSTHRTNREIGAEWAMREAALASDQGRKVADLWRGTDDDALALVPSRFYAPKARRDQAMAINYHARATWDHLVFVREIREIGARVWCEEHAREVKAGGLTIERATGELLAGRLYRVDTGSAGHDCVVDADSENEAIELVCDYANASGETAEILRAKFDPWSAKQIRIGGAN